MEKTNKNFNKIRSKIDAIKKINDNGNKEIGDVFDLVKNDLPSIDGVLYRNIDDFKTKAKTKKTENIDIFSKLILTSESSSIYVSSRTTVFSLSKSDKLITLLV
jgi:hypothetical protein